MTIEQVEKRIKPFIAAVRVLAANRLRFCGGLMQSDKATLNNFLAAVRADREDRKRAGTKTAVLDAMSAPPNVDDAAVDRLQAACEDKPKAEQAWKCTCDPYGDLSGKGCICKPAPPAPDAVEEMAGAMKRVYFPHLHENHSGYEAWDETARFVLAKIASAKADTALAYAEELAKRDREHAKEQKRQADAEPKPASAAKKGKSRGKN